MIFHYFIKLFISSGIIVLASEIAKKNNLFVMVDAAGQIYPLENLSKYSNMGADSVSYAAKYFGAPHSTGFVVGTKEIVDKVALQSFISFEL